MALINDDQAAVLKTDALTPSNLEIFKAFFFIGLFGFGGVLPWTRRMLVETNQWLSSREFSELLSLAQLFPGPNVANIATMLGRKYNGKLGATLALIGLYLAPSIVITFLGYGYANFHSSEVATNILGILMPVVVGLVVATAMKLLKSTDLDAHSVFFFISMVVAVGFLRLPLWMVLTFAIPASIFWVRIVDDRGK